MTILVLGATSMIGREIAAAFAAGNRMLLCGRHPERLEDALRACRAAGAESVAALAGDLRRGAAGLLDRLDAVSVDLVIHAASATSRLRDPQIGYAELPELVSAEITAPTAIIAAIVQARSGRDLGVVFVSSVLAAALTPNRAIYGSLKRIQERALANLREIPGVTVTIVRVGQVVPTGAPSSRARRVAATVRRAYEARAAMATAGRIGQTLVAVHNISPWAFTGIVRGIRWARRIRAGGNGTPRTGVAPDKEELACRS